MYAIEVENIHKSYGKKRILNDVSFSVQEGHIFGLLGPNGAGKTTLVKSLLGLVHYQAQKAQFFGVDCLNPRSRQRVGLLPDKFIFYPYYTVKQTMDFYAQMYGQSQKESWQNNAIEQLGIPEIENQKIPTLSKGQLQRTGLACLILSKADLYVLDEPFSGLDPLGVRELKEILLTLKSQGKTLFINSHVLSEIEKICDDMAILHQGRCLAQGSLAELKGEKNLDDFFYETVKGDQK